METVVQDPASQDLHLLTEWGSPGDSTRQWRARAISLVTHVVIIATVMLLPVGVTQAPREVERHVTPLVEPPTELTQKAPNKNKVIKEFNVATIEPRPRIQIPAGLPSTTRPQAARPLPPPSPPPGPKQPIPEPPLPEPPRIETKEPPKVELPQVAQANPPQIQPVEKPPEEKPKLALETPGAPPPVTGGGGRGRLPVPDTSVSEAIRQAIGGAAGGLVIGDPGVTGPAGLSEGMNLPPSQGVEKSNLELLSDPQGVDFRPYLIRILAVVRQNWRAVIPEAARLGRRGTVSVQFAIARTGAVTKVVYVTQSGTRALDEAAVAGISMSNPFAPLPSEFKGDRIILQFNFAYNMPR
jgi:TonB family protein